MCPNSHTDERPYVRLYGENNTCKFKELRQNVSWDAMYTDGSDWYDNLINLVYTEFQQSFPLVRLSRKRAKYKPWITKGIKISIKVKHRLYKLYLKNSYPGAKTSSEQASRTLSLSITVHFPKIPKHLTIICGST